MSWVQDIIRIMQEWVIAQGYATVDWVLAQGYLSHGFVDRGSSNFFDFAVGDFTKDSGWHLLNVSGIVPDGARCVLYRVQLKNNLVGKNVFFRPPGHAGTATGWQFKNRIANVAWWGEFCVPIGDVRFVEYWMTAGGWTVINLKIAGWWL